MANFLSSTRVRYARLALQYLMLLGIVLLISRHDGAFRGEFGDFPDESAHYVSGLMVRDYLTSFHASRPFQFAEMYYLHYPKVAVGHWPPLMYLIEGLWMILFSPSRASLMCLMAALTALIGIIVYRMLRDRVGMWCALSASVVTMALPVTQDYTTRVMADIPLTLFSLVAALFFARYLDLESLKDSLGFGAFAAMALLTKGNAAALALLPPVAILLSRKWQLIRRFSLWSSALLVVAVCGPWYWMARRMLNGDTWVQTSPSSSYVLFAAHAFSQRFPMILGWPLLILAALGLCVRVRRIIQDPKSNSFWIAMISLAFSYFAALCLIPVGSIEDRYLLPAVPALVALSVGGLDWLAEFLPMARAKSATLGVTLIALFAISPFRFRTGRNYGFAPIAETLDSSPEFRDDVMLIASDSNGEGMFISEAALHEHRPGHFILRATKVLSIEDWNGTRIRQIFDSPQQVEQYLDSVPVSVVLIDRSSSKEDFRDYERLLDETIASHPDTWRLARTYPIWREDVECPDAVSVFVRKTPVRNPRGQISIDMTNMLGGSITTRPNDQQQEKNLSH